MDTKEVIEQVHALRHAWVQWRDAGQKGFDPVSPEELNHRIDLLSKVLWRLEGKSCE